MTTLNEKLRELIETAPYLPDGAIEAEARAFLSLAADWPTTTQVPLARVAYVIAAMMVEADPHVRRAIATDALNMRDALG
jgi:hypothetical protein